jgi:hypothetical protein
MLHEIQVPQYFNIDILFSLILLYNAAENFLIVAANSFEQLLYNGPINRLPYFRCLQQ